MASEDEFLLKWHDHHQSFFLLVEELVLREQLTDVTLACGDANNHQLLSAHSLMLSVCSPYFRSLLSENRHKEKHHIIHLHGVSSRHMQQLLLYMYRGEISISQEDLGPLIETARCLQIKGLSMATPNMPLSTPKKRPHSSVNGPEPCPNTTSAPPGARRKKDNMQGRDTISGRMKRPSSSPLPDQMELPHNVSREEPEEHMDGQSGQVEPIRPGAGSPEAEIGESPAPAVMEAGKMAGPTLGQEYGLGFQGKLHTSPLPLSGNVSLPLLPKPLSILKTAETRTFLSKLIWLGNGGRRPQYGNPDTKPCWWPQHILPWEEMKKMGGRKSVELSHINYTEILKQCLSAGYEYFGYDPLTYYSNDHSSNDGLDYSYSLGDNSVLMEEEEEVLAIEEEEEDLKTREPVLEIDLDAVETCTKNKPDIRKTEQGQDILCK